MDSSLIKRVENVTYVRIISMKNLIAGEVEVLGVVGGLLDAPDLPGTHFK